MTLAALLFPWLLALPGADAHPPAAPPATRGPIVIYLHGRFVEEHAPHEASPEHGVYEYAAILHALGRDGARVLSERRPRDTDVSAYADQVVAQVDALIDAGQAPADITVVGASKGAVIAALVSSRLAEPDLHYVLMASCNAWLEESWRPRLQGRVLSIFDRSDAIGGSCREIAARSDAIAAFDEIELRTGLGHGFLYRPLDAWVAPALAWAAKR